MVIADLFVNLGIKGNEKTVEAFVGLEQSIKNVASMSIEAKAAILGAAYAVEQLFAKSSAQGTALSNFSTLLGEDVKTIQQYQYAGRQVGVTNEDIASSFKGLQDVATKVRYGIATPSFWGPLQQALGKTFTTGDIETFMRNPELLLQRLQVFAQKTQQQAGFRNAALRSFGLSDTMIAALSKNVFRADVFKNAPTYSDKDVKQLQAADAAWRNLGVSIQMAVGRLNVRYGGTLVRDFQSLIDLGLKFIDVVVKLADKLKLFQGIQTVFKAVISAIQAIEPPIEKFANAPAKAAVNGGIFEKISASMASIGRMVDRILPLFAKIGDEIVRLVDKAKYFEHLYRIFTDLAAIFEKLEIIIVKVSDKILAFADRFKIIEKLGTFIGSIMGGVEKYLETLGSVLDKVAGLIGIPTTVAAAQAAPATGGEASAAPAPNKVLSGVFAGLVNDVLGNIAPATAAAPTTSPISTRVPPSPVAGSVIRVPAAPSKETKESSLIKESSKTEIIPKIAPAAPAASVNVVVPPAPSIPAVTPVPNAKGPGPSGNQTTQNLTVNQSITVPPGSQPTQTADHVKKAVNDAFRQLSAQVQGS